MPKLSETQLSDLTGHGRRTIKIKLDGVPHEIGDHKARLYDSKLALQTIYRGGESSDGETEEISAAEAQRQLTIARKDQVLLEMEVTRKERIPIDVIESNNERVFSNLAGLFKAHKGKFLDDALIADLFTELRGLGSVLSRR